MEGHRRVWLVHYHLRYAIRKLHLAGGDGSGQARTAYKVPDRCQHYNDSNCDYINIPVHHIGTSMFSSTTRPSNR
jgi:hypothetical protein